MSIVNLQRNLNKIIKLQYKDVNEALTILTSIKDDAKYHGYEYDLFRVALIHNINKNYDQSRKDLEYSLSIAHKNNNKFVINEVSMSLAYIYMAKKEYDLALKLYLGVVDYQSHPNVLNNIGHIYFTIGDYRESLVYYEKSHDVIESYRTHTLYDNGLRSIILVNLADVYCKFGKFEKSKESAFKSLKIAKVSNNDYGIATALYTLCKIEIEYSNYETAIAYVKEAIDFFNKCFLMNQDMINDDIEDSLRLYSKVINLCGDYIKSNEIINSIVNKTKEDYELQIENYEALKAYEMAYKTYKIHLLAVKQKEIEDKKVLIESYKSKVRILEAELKVDKFQLLYNNTKSISDIGREIISTDNLDDITEVLYQKINKIMNFETIAIGAVDLDKKILHYDWIYEENQKQDPITVDIDDKNRFSSWVIRNKEAIKLNEAITGKEVLKYKEEIKTFTQGTATESMIMCPIMIKGEILGIISVQSILKYQYTEYDLEVLKMLSSFIAVAMKNWKNKESLKDANEQLKVLSKTDALTGIKNRHVLSEIVEDLFNEGSSSSNVLSVVMIDIDYFKEFNDTYGHVKGDQCIIEVVKELALSLDVDGNQLFRYGGDEFLGIIPDLSHKKVEALLESTRKHIEDLNILNEHSKISKYVTCCFGFTTITKSKSMDYQKAFYLADKALYVAKANGKNQVAYETL